MGKQAVPAVKHPGNGILLVRAQLDFRCHTGKADMAAVIFTGFDAVEDLIVFLAQHFPALRVFPYHFLFLLGQHGFFRVEDTLFRAVCIVDGVIHPAVPQI